MSRSLHLTTGGARMRDLAALRMRPGFHCDSHSVAPLDAPEVMPAGACDSTSTQGGSTLAPAAAQSEARRDHRDVWQSALAAAMPGVRAGTMRAALTQSGTNWGIPLGAAMGEFIAWAEAQLIGGC